MDNLDDDTVKHPPAEPAKPIARPTPWYHRSGPLLGLGAAVLVVAIVVALLARDDGGEKVASGGEGGDGTETTEPGEAEVDLVARFSEAEGVAAAWIFDDPNRSIREVDSYVQPALWLLDDVVVVASTDIVRGHDVETGEIAWEQPTGEVCGAAANVAPDAESVVLATFDAEDRCTDLRALDVATGEELWSDSTVAEYGIGGDVEAILVVPGGVMINRRGDLQVRHPDTGRVLVDKEDEELGREAGLPGRVVLEAPAAMSADGSVIVAPGRLIGDAVPESPTVAVGLHPKSFEVVWATELAPSSQQVRSQVEDGAWIRVGADPGEMVRVDPATGEVEARWPLRDFDTDDGRSLFEIYSFDGASWYRSGTTFVDGDPVVAWEQAAFDPSEEYGQTVEHLVRHDAETGEEVWRFRPNDLSQGHDERHSKVIYLSPGPMLDERHMLVAAGGIDVSYLVVLDVETGKEVHLLEQPAEVGGSALQQQPALEVLADGSILMGFNPNGGTNSVDEAAESGEDMVALTRLHLRG